jgi:phospholipase/carboxylesterase
MMSSQLAVFTFVTCMIFSVVFLVVGSSNASALERPGRVAVQGQVAQPTAFRTHELFTAQIAQRPANAQKSRHLVIFFHGIRGGGTQFTTIGKSWEKTLANTSFVYPDAPFAHRSGGRQWFVVDDQVMRPDRIQGARRAFDELVSEIVRREGFEGNLRNVAFVGVSQGAIMALDAVANGRWKVGAVVSFAGMLPLAISASNDARVLLIHGRADKTIPSAASVAAGTQLKAAGFDVTVTLLPDVGHTISSSGAQKASMFLQNYFNR